MSEPRTPAAELTVTPIGVMRTPFTDRASVPRQPSAARGVAGRIELLSDGRFEHALEDLDTFSHVWVLFWFHLSEGWKAKVRPPRSEQRRGVFATRAPHRPNPIGMSVLRLERVEGFTIHVLDVDLVDGTPVLDVKPYLPYVDAVPDADHGWLDETAEGAEALGAAASGAVADPTPSFEVTATELATAQLGFLKERGVDLWPRIAAVLEAGPMPHPYRRIRRHADGDAFVLAAKEWRARFTVAGPVVTVEAVLSGYRPSQIYGGDPALEVHRAYVERFGTGAAERR